MAEQSYTRIVCVRTEHPHRHIVSVGIGTDPFRPRDTLPVAKVRELIDKGEIFFTYDGRDTALVDPFTCTEKTVSGVECGYKTIRSKEDASAANNLDNLVSCP
jgi:hypothetical protein